VSPRDWLNDFEQLLMLAIVHLGDEAYGMRVRLLLQHRVGREVPITSIYAALDRLEARGYLATWMSDPTPERGGRAKKHFAVTDEGFALLREGRDALDRMWQDLPAHPRAGRTS